jgi:NAD(P)-dependent dehydrogenase (short-subunit alcohol dehydrogenase family)
MKILILGAAGQIARSLTDQLLKQTNHDIVLYARNAQQRLKVADTTRVTLVDGDFNDEQSLTNAMKDVDLVYLNSMGDVKAASAIVEAMNLAGTDRIIGASILGIYDEVPGAFGKWNSRMVGDAQIQKQADSVSKLEIDKLNYTILRLTWLYNKAGKTEYMLTQKGEPFEGAQVTREAVSQLIMDIINDKSGKFFQTSIGVSEPNTNWGRPSFY